MTNFAYWAAQVPEGQFMCCLCFESKPLAEAWRDSAGQAWDVCAACQAIEDAVRAQRSD